MKFWVLQPWEATTEAGKRAGPSREQKDPWAAGLKGPSPMSPAARGLHGERAAESGRWGSQGGPHNLPPQADRSQATRSSPAQPAPRRPRAQPVHPAEPETAPKGRPHRRTPAGPGQPGSAAPAPQPPEEPPPAHYAAPHPAPLPAHAQRRAPPAAHRSHPRMRDAATERRNCRMRYPAGPAVSGSRPAARCIVGAIEEVKWRT